MKSEPAGGVEHGKKINLPMPGVVDSIFNYLGPGAPS